MVSRTPYILVLEWSELILIFMYFERLLIIMLGILEQG